MLLYKRIEIPNWKLIQEKFSYLASVRTGNEWIYLLDNNEIAELTKLLPVFPERKIKSALAFGQGPLAAQEIHVDGYNVTRTRSSDTALNIPIKSHGQMTWYHGKYELEEAVSPSKVKYLKLNWFDEPVVKNTAVIDSPTVVKIDVPHRVINLVDDLRIVLSIRYSPDIFLG